jgi:hypothetical protein
VKRADNMKLPLSTYETDSRWDIFSPSIVSIKPLLASPLLEFWRTFLMISSFLTKEAPMSQILENLPFSEQTYFIYLLWRFREISRSKRHGSSYNATFGELATIPNLENRKDDEKFLEKLLVLMEGGFISEFTLRVILPEDHGEVQIVKIDSHSSGDLAYVRRYLSKDYATYSYFIKIRTDRIEKYIEQFLSRWWNKEFIVPNTIIYPIHSQYQTLLNHLLMYKDVFIDQWHSIREATFWENFDFFLLLLFFESRSLIELATEEKEKQLTEDYVYDDEIARSFQIRIMGNLSKLKEAKHIVVSYDPYTNILTIDEGEITFGTQQARILEFFFDQISHGEITFQDMLDDPSFADLDGVKSWEYKYLSNTFGNINRKLADSGYPELFHIVGGRVSFGPKYLVTIQENREFNLI